MKWQQLLDICSSFSNLPFSFIYVWSFMYKASKFEQRITYPILVGILSMFNTEGLISCVYSLFVESGIRNTEFGYNVTLNSFSRESCLTFFFNLKRSLVNPLDFL